MRHIYACMHMFLPLYERTPIDVSEILHRIIFSFCFFEIVFRHPGLILVHLSYKKSGIGCVSAFGLLLLWSLPLFTVLC